ncbi:hypothetical protein GQ44DRAFT_44152 [Phaeosphaeriaceae sp. PMI808]|nr:hypothetical protein GQ44DRAFT_44152 [Phaeosphaeriaceae sp. PMI808]
MSPSVDKVSKRGHYPNQLACTHHCLRHAPILVPAVSPRQPSIKPSMQPSTNITLGIVVVHPIPKLANDPVSSCLSYTCPTQFYAPIGSVSPKIGAAQSLMDPIDSRLLVLHSKWPNIGAKKQKKVSSARLLLYPTLPFETNFFASDKQLDRLCVIGTT